MNDISVKKNSIRKLAYRKRSEAFYKVPQSDFLKAASFFLHNVPYQKKTIIGGYRPIKTEFNPNPLLYSLYQENIPLCIPVIHNDKKSMSFAQWNLDMPMEKSFFNTEIPLKIKWVLPDIILTPLVAFDHTGTRIGYGGGFYDRFIKKMRSKQNILVVGYAFASQEFNLLPYEETDQRLDVIITEKEILWINKEP